jgi:hypothetical protein
MGWLNACSISQMRREANERSIRTPFRPEETDVAYRYYLRTEEGLRRLPHAFFEQDRAFPQLAGTRQRAILAFRDKASSKIEVLTRNTGLVTFDAAGRHDRETLYHWRKRRMRMMPGRALSAPRSLTWQ